MSLVRYEQLLIKRLFAEKESWVGGEWRLCKGLRLASNFCPFEWLRQSYIITTFLCILLHKLLRSLGLLIELTNS